MGQRPYPMVRQIPEDNRDWRLRGTRLKVVRDQPALPPDWSGFREERIGSVESRHLRATAEYTIVNVGGSHAEGCSPPMKRVSVGGVIVLGGRESRPQGEGRQPFGNAEQNNRMLTGMKFP